MSFPGLTKTTVKERTVTLVSTFSPKLTMKEKLIYLCPLLN